MYWVLSTEYSVPILAERRIGLWRSYSPRDNCSRMPIQRRDDNRRGVITMAAMGSRAYFRDWRIRAIRGLKYVVRWHVPGGDSDLGDLDAVRQLHSYARRPTVCIESLMQLLRVLERELPQVTAPALIMHGRRDRTVDVRNAAFILEAGKESDDTSRTETPATESQSDDSKPGDDHR